MDAESALVDTLRHVATPARNRTRGDGPAEKINIYDLVTWSRRREPSPEPAEPVGPVRPVGLAGHAGPAGPARFCAPPASTAPTSIASPSSRDSASTATVGESPALPPAVAPVPPTLASALAPLASISVASASPVPHASPAPAVSLATLRPSLKARPSHGHTFSGASGSSGSLKNVRFAHQLTTVKRFDTRSEPMSISTENSPQPSPRLAPFKTFSLGAGDEEDDGEESGSDDDQFWFGTALSRTKLPLDDIQKGPKFGTTTLNLFDSALYSESDCDSISDCEADLSYSEPSGVPALKRAAMPPIAAGKGSIGGGESQVAVSSLPFGRGGASAPSQPRFAVTRWHLASSDIEPLVTRRAIDLQSHILAHLQGHNIKLNRVSACLDTKKIQGLIYVTNLNFEKALEIKFTFNNWKDIHYVSAYHHRSVTDAIDEFKFTIHLSGLSFFMQSKKLLFCDPNMYETCCPLSMELCCRYDVNGETYYDNNNYNNYHVNLQAFTKPIVRRDSCSAPNLPNLESELLPRHTSSSCTLTSENTHKEPRIPQAKSFGNDFLVTTTMSHKKPKPSQTTSGRQFSDDTDYFNTSPLKHLFHNDTTLVKPSRINEVTFDATPTSPMHFLFGEDLSEKHFTHSSPPSTLLRSPDHKGIAQGSGTSLGYTRLDTMPHSTSSSVETSSSSSSSIASQKPRSLQEFAPPGMERNLYLAATEPQHEQRPTPDSSSSSVDYETLRKTYCFYDNNDRTDTSIDPKPSFWTRHASSPRNTVSNVPKY
ncbi:LAQU0S06e01794g1_1 [Lachancea quebecensis]|uniref:LAQU0S06e01794g1_1 n=1 Tax=Lachancea quebecensis TaxID=1654605 RepID=A0A0P1KSA5_9SACH|nr:LAQU0S06e01794g1_1 [Lachancea quebecensis]